MSFRSIVTAKRKRIALIAHDNMKRDILEWARFNKGTLSRHELYGTGTTGGMIENELVAGRSVVISRWGLVWLKGASTSSSSSGIH
jgi:hypothetical protein